MATITFDASSHTYRIGGMRLGASVSTLVSKHWPQFNAAQAAARCGPVARIKWTNDPDATDEMVMAAWKEHGRRAAQLGTELHERIECFIKGDTNHRLDSTTSTWIANRFGPGWSLDPEKCIAGAIIPGGRLIPGTVDLLARDPENNWWIFDWKRGSIDNVNGDMDAVTGVVGTKFVRYSTQLALYAAILSNAYNIIVPPERRKLVHVTEDCEPEEIDVQNCDGLAQIIAALE